MSAGPARRHVWRRFRRNAPAMAAAAALVVIVLLAVGAPWVTGGQPFRGSVLRRLLPVGTPGHWLGTDEVGRDMWTRLVYGARLSLLSGMVPVGLAVLVGGTLGVVAGYAGGWLNAAVMRATDVLYAFPSVLLAIGIGAVIGSGLLNTIAALTVVFIPPFVRLTESLALQLRRSDFVEAARASGVGAGSIIRHHVLGNLAGSVLVYAASMTGLSIVLGAGLSFLGLGLPPPNAEWGQMLNALRQSIYVSPWQAALPGFMIFVTAVCFNLVSDGLRAALDVR